MTNKTSLLNRRKFLKYTSAGVAALTLPLSAMPTLAGITGAQSKKWGGLKKAIVINNLGGISNPNNVLKAKGPAPTNKNPIDNRAQQNLDPRALKDAHASGMTAVNVTIGYVAGTMDPFKHSHKEVDKWNKIIDHHSQDLIKINSAADITAAKKAGKIGIILGFQNATMMGDDATRVDSFADKGVKIIQLTYNVRNQLGDGSMMTDNRGLTKFGHEVVERLNTKNTVVDLSHSGEQTCLDAIRASSKPIAITHTGCRALSDLQRNKTDEELRLLADKGGVMGVYFMPFLKEDSFPEPQDVIRHIEHAINICGEDHVGIGTDGGTTRIDDLEAYRAFTVKEIARRRAAGISAKGEKPGVVPFVPNLSGPGQFQKLADMLYSNGHSSARIEKILGGNFLRFYKEVWGA